MGLLDHVIGLGATALLLGIVFVLARNQFRRERSASAKTQKTLDQSGQGQGQGDGVQSWSMVSDAELRRMDEYYRAHPPRCIAGFEAEPVELEGAVFDGHGEVLNPVFRLRCVCGHDKGYVQGYYWRNPDYRNELVFLSPLTFRCEQCEEVTEIIDTDIHGYNAEVGGGSCTVRGRGERGETKCDKCGAQPFEIYSRFEFPADLFDEDFVEARGREQDLFTWFSLLGRCSSCLRQMGIADFECA